MQIAHQVFLKLASSLNTEATEIKVYRSGREGKRMKEKGDGREGAEPSGAIELENKRLEKNVNQTKFNWGKRCILLYPNRSFVTRLDGRAIAPHLPPP